MRTFKLARHLRRKKRFAEAEEKQEEARAMHLRVTQAWFDTVQHDAEVQMARLVKQQALKRPGPCVLCIQSSKLIKRERG